MKTGYGNWKGPFKDAVKGVDYIDPCPPGTYLVRGYRRSDGVEVPAYCRERTKEEIDRMSAEMRDLRNKKSEYEGYHEGEADEPLEAINDILRQFNYYDRSDIDFSTPEGKPISSKEFYKNGGDFSVVVTGYQHEYMISGNVHKKNGKWVAGAESEEVKF